MLRREYVLILMALAACCCLPLLAIMRRDLEEDDSKKGFPQTLLTALGTVHIDGKETMSILPPQEEDNIETPSSYPIVSYALEDGEMEEDSDSLFCDRDVLPISLGVSNTPRRCWPRIFILPSFPTSGSELAQVLFQGASGFLTGSVYESKSSYPFVAEGDMKMFLHSTGRRLPLGEQSGTLMKTHFPTNASPGNRAIYGVYGDWENGSFTQGVVRLARNPGDHLLRNTFRWGNKDCTGECFMAKAKRTCGRLEGAAALWRKFHEYWNNFATEQIIVHYETLSDATLVKATLHGLFDFMELEVEDESIAIAASSVREPSYKQGSLVATICGVDVALRVHSLTKDLSERLGYTFDETTGSWSLALGVKSPLPFST